MASAHATFLADLNAQGFKSGLRAIERETQQSTARISREFEKAGKSTFASKAGGISMQAADIGVQLQGGARAATVLAQQGSQILQMFGPTGQIAAGVVAIGAGIYSWATNAEAAKEEVKALMSELASGQRFSSELLKGAKNDEKLTRMAGIGGSRADIGRLKTTFDDDIKKMREDFAAQPKNLQDEGALRRAIEERTKRFDMERGNLYDAHSDRAEKDKETRISDVREHERDQMRLFGEHEKQKMEDDEKEAREGLIESIKQAEKVEKENTERNERIGELREQLARAVIENQAARGDSILAGANQHMMSQDERIAHREFEQAQGRAVEREISRRLDRADQYRRSIGTPMTREEREELRNTSRDDVKAAQNKQKLLAAIDPDSIKQLADEINKLIAK